MSWQPPLAHVILHDRTYSPEGASVYRTLSLIAVVALLSPGNAIAQSRAPIVIRAGTLLDGKGGSRRNVDIVVNGRTIEAVRPAGREAPTQDLSRFTVMPGGI